MKSFYSYDYYISKIIDALKSESVKWVNGHYEKKLIADPIDHEVIRGHYADTHFSAAYILLSDENDQFFSLGKSILLSFLEELNLRNKQRDYHADFNNFAMSIIANELRERNICLDLVTKIDDALLNERDSRNYTINWLPMRIYVNDYRYKLTGNKNYRTECEKLERMILAAINADNTIEDRSPSGISYNLQYNVSTVAELVFLKEQHYVFRNEFKIKEYISQLFSMVCPDGDINYMGRGCNQIFAWGPWLYIIKYAGNQYITPNSLSFIYDRIFIAIKNNNILLNSFDGKDKLFWWDYHYCSVYYSHLLMWLALSKKMKQKIDLGDKLQNQQKTINIIKNKEFTVAFFDGRKEYWCESGPNICFIYSNSRGAIFKGGYGPWLGHFGNKYKLPSYTLRNKVGIIGLRETSNTISNRLFDRFGIVIRRAPTETIQPINVTMDIFEIEKVLIIRYTLNNAKKAYLNLPVLDSIDINCLYIRVFADENEVNTVVVGKIPNQYGWCNLIESNAVIAKTWEVRISLA